MRGIYLLTAALLLTGCSASEADGGYADGEAVAEAIGCSKVRTEDTITGPTTYCYLGDADLEITDWGTADDDYRQPYIERYEDAGYVTIEAGDRFTVWVRSQYEDAVTEVKKQLD